MWSCTKKTMKDYYKKHVLVYTNQNQTEKVGVLQFIENVFLKVTRNKVISQGELISLTKGQIHSVQAENGTATVLFNYGHLTPNNVAPFFYPPDVTVKSNFSFDKVSPTDAISGMLSFIIDRLKQDPPSCPINPLNEIECAENL